MCHEFCFAFVFFCLWKRTVGFFSHGFFFFFVVVWMDGWCGQVVWGLGLGLVVERAVIRDGA